MIDQVRLKKVRARWETEQKIAATDVRWLLSLADLAATHESTRPFSRPASWLDDLFKS